MTIVDPAGTVRVPPVQPKYGLTFTDVPADADVVPKTPARPIAAAMTSAIAPAAGRIEVFGISRLLSIS